MNKDKQRELKKSVSAFAKPDTQAGVRQLINTILPFALLWYLAYASLSISVWLTIPVAMIAGGFVVRIFIIFHDCTHQSFLKSQKANRIIGTITGILTLFPFDKWKRSHSIHHATSGNLDKRGTGDIWVMTVDEYVEASFKERIAYRIYRNPIVMFGLGPLYLFLISNRFNRKGAKKKERRNTYVTNVSITVLYSLLIWAIGWEAFLLIQLPILYVSGILGIWLFYVQHQFEDSYFEDESEWDFVKAAVDGSSYYKLPKLLQWVSGNIGFHHVHHLSPRVPNYALEDAHEHTPPLQHATTITLATSLESIRFRLYDTENKTFVSFKEVKPLLKKKRLAMLDQQEPTFQDK
ncbi:omega-6 fatty acid desaturase (delta-12 desaturase) [Halobacillus karajensis]|uniref:Fatty acid desaturase n=1 Tax=Halobacillus karajensis TaxID=195088 RepID=A0A059NZ79_9BACI|nr:fatty acid desaturase [Halobacillus karajensis]CDQ18551.1 Fatty acid desaturase [Halobacillus karajensis]CDQ23377.1 Fatty acid desaturase [Halobacillus karajensis]CDQ26859.1 Fatty acid desaturase [Halobacillus karajensis]SEH50028.1 omega-6 fatty acid desaturase (delta-12 desaturase) [Halobacillus karajensis]